MPCLATSKHFWLLIVTLKHCERSRLELVNELYLFLHRRHLSRCELTFFVSRVVCFLFFLLLNIQVFHCLFNFSLLLFLPLLLHVLGECWPSRPNLVEVEVSGRCLASQKFIIWPVVLSSFCILFSGAVSAQLFLRHPINLKVLASDCQDPLQDSKDVCNMLFRKVPLIIVPFEVHYQLLTSWQRRSGERVDSSNRDFSVHVVIEWTKVKSDQI